MTIQTIIASLNHPQAAEGNKDLYCFDSDEHGLIAEPFVHSATMAIHLPLRWTLGFEHFNRNSSDQGDSYRMSQAVLLRFTDSPDEMSQLLAGGDPVVELVLSRSTPGQGNDYFWQVIHPEEAVDVQFFEKSVFPNTAWLCPVLLQYFPAGAPERFWVSVHEEQPPAH